MPRRRPGCIVNEHVTALTEVSPRAGGVGQPGYGVGRRSPTISELSLSPRSSGPLHWSDQRPIT
jgi:hypothetical protein